jgi:heme exporter protein C
VPRPQTLRTLGWLWLALTVVMLALGLRLAFTAPTEVTMGDVQRIFYYHVPMQVGGLTFPFVNLIGSLAYLYYRRRDLERAISFDAIAIAAAEVTVLFVSVGILSGMLWAKPVWGIWWTWDERLTTDLLLWLLYVSYLLVRRFSSTGQMYTLAAVLSVFAAIDVPIVYMSTRWYRTQHPSPVFFAGDSGHLDPSFAPAFYTNFAAWLMWGFFLIGVRYALERRRQRAHHAAVQQAIANPEAQ